MVCGRVMEYAVMQYPYQGSIDRVNYPFPISLVPEIVTSKLERIVAELLNITSNVKARIVRCKYSIHASVHDVIYRIKSK